MQFKLRQVSSIAIAAILAFTLVACVQVDGEREGSRQTVDIEQVPPPVKATIVSQSAGATVQGIEKIDWQGKSVYEAHLVASGRKSELRVGEDGRVLPADSDKDDDD